MINWIRSNYKTFFTFFLAIGLIALFRDFFIKALSVALGVVIYLTPIFFKVGFGTFLFVTKAAFIWMGLIALTVFLAPVGGIRKHLDISYPDGDASYTDEQKMWLATEEIYLTLWLPITYLPSLLYDAAWCTAVYVVKSGVTLATDLKNAAVFLVLWPFKKVNSIYQRLTQRLTESL